MSTESVEPRKSIVGVAVDSKKVYGDRVKLIGKHEVDDKVRKNSRMSKSKKLSKSKKMVESLDFLILRAKLAFTKLRQRFFKSLIFYYFNPKHHIQIEIDVSEYAIG